MRNLLLQLFEYKYVLRNQIEELQKKESHEINKELQNELHREWDRIEHMIDLFLKAVGM